MGGKEASAILDASIKSGGATASVTNPASAKKKKGAAKKKKVSGTKKKAGGAVKK